MLAITSIFAISIITFVIITLPPGDFLDAKIAELESMGDGTSFARIREMQAFYGLDKPIWQQYYVWISNMSRGSFGRSLDLDIPVMTLIGERLLITIVLALATKLFMFGLAIPIGIYSAVRKHSVGDYTFTFIGFVGLAVPDFLLALVMMYLAFAYFGANIGGLFSAQYIEAPWDLGRVVDLLTHLWIPAFVLGTSGTAALIRVMRNNLLDELARPYVVTARSKGIGELRLIMKYPVRVALNPLISTIGYVLPFLISGSVIVSVVLSLPTVGPILLRSLLQQDMYLAGTIILLLGALTIVGTLISDILLMVFDPRIRLEDS